MHGADLMQGKSCLVGYSYYDPPPNRAECVSQDRTDPNFTDPAVFSTGKLRNSNGSPSARGVHVSDAGKLRILASGFRPLNIAYCAAVALYLKNLLQAKEQHKRHHAGYVRETQRMRDESKKRHRVIFAPPPSPFISIGLFELPPEADTGTDSAGWPCCSLLNLPGVPFDLP
jgi:hypothetical protein